MSNNNKLSKKKQVNSSTVQSLMGNNNQKQNAEFGKNFNFAEHQRKMAHINQNYVEHNLPYSRDGSQQVNAPKQQSYKQLQRSNAIFKPSIQINLTVHELRIKFQYKSLQGCDFMLFLGVNNINEDPNKKSTTEIEADYKFYERLESGNKNTFQKIYPTHDKNLMNKQIILRIQQDGEATQISLRRVKQTEQHWKIILQKLQIQNQAYQLQNIYGGGDSGQQCIVCMCELSNTIVRPCNHVCLCRECANGISQRTNKCPICRKQITDLVTINANSSQ